MMRSCLEKRGMLKLLVLKSVAEKPLHVYGIIKAIEGLTGIAPSAGAIYPALRSLERAGLVEVVEAVKEGRRAKLYRATPLGLKHLQEHEKEVEEITRAAACWRSFREMGGDRLLRLIKEIVKASPALTEAQRAELRKALLEFEIKALSIMREVRS